MCQGVVQNRMSASVESSEGDSLPALPIGHQQFVYSLPPAPKGRTGGSPTAIKLPASVSACAGRLDVPSVSAGVVKLTAKQGLKGQTTGDSKLDALIITSAVRNKVDPALLFSVMKQESAFNNHAVSRVGARGLMQLMPETATRFGVRNVFNSAQNVEAGARYIRFLLDNFGGDVSLALAAYNAGEGTVRKYGKSIPPYPETVKYVSRIRQRYEGICTSRVVKGV